MKTFSEFLEEAHLYEMRKEDKVKGKKKTPLIVPHTRKYIDHLGNTVTHTGNIINSAASGGWFRQGLPLTNAAAPEGIDARHEHGGETGYRGVNYLKPGKLRRKRKVPGEKKPPIGHQTPAQRVAEIRAKREQKGTLRTLRTLGGI